MEGRKREDPQVTVELGPLRALLRHCLRPRKLPDIAAAESNITGSRGEKWTKTENQRSSLEVREEIRKCVKVTHSQSVNGQTASLDDAVAELQLCSTL